MAGGTWISQNKVRPGAYIKFKGVPANNNIVGKRGVVAMLLPMSWGALNEITKITINDILSSKAEALLGDDLTNILPLYLAFQNAHTVLAYRAGDETAKAAKVELDVTAATANKLTATAKYTGKSGNKISVGVSRAYGSTFAVSTYFGTNQKDYQIVTKLEDLKSNDFVEFKGTGAITKEAVNTLLTGGVDGAIKSSDYASFLTKLEQYEFDTLAAWKLDNVSDLFNGNQIKQFILKMRDVKGMRCQAVVNSFSANHESIISLNNQGVKMLIGNDIVSVKPEMLVTWVAGATAGADVTESNTYKVLKGATELVDSNDDIETSLQQGYFMFSRRRDGSIVVEKDINTLVSLRDDVTEAFKENKVVRLMDAVANHIANDFEQNYIGKVSADSAGLALFKSSIITYLSDLQTAGAIVNFVSTQDVKLELGEKADSFYSEIYLQPVYSVNKLYMVINVK